MNAKRRTHNAKLPFGIVGLFSGNYLPTIGKNQQDSWTLFSQNKPNTKTSKITVSDLSSTGYCEQATGNGKKYKPNSNPIKANLTLTQKPEAPAQGTDSPTSSLKHQQYCSLPNDIPNKMNPHIASGFGMFANYPSMEHLFLRNEPNFQRGRNTISPSILRTTSNEQICRRPKRTQSNPIL